MNRDLRRNFFAGPLILLFFLIMPSISSGAGTAGLGPRAGYDFDSDKIVLGGEAEFGRVLQYFRFAPSVDFELGDNKLTTMNGDFRLYLFNLPETGLRFYGSAGPSLSFISPHKGDSQTKIGLSLVAGVRIPMKGQSRYNIETRFGTGDVPDFKLMFAVLFGI